MGEGVIVFVLRLALVVVLWHLVWRLVQPKTQAMRILRASLLVVSLLAALALTRLAAV